MPRANSLLLRLTMLALALNVGCAFPFFRSKDKSLEEVVAVENMTEEKVEAKTTPAPRTVDNGEKPMPPIARFFGGLFGRGKSKPEAPADPISTIPATETPTAASVANSPQPKIEFNNTGDIGAGVVAPKQEQPTQVVVPQVSNLAEMKPTPATPQQQTASPKSSLPAEIANPHTVATAPQDNAAPPITEVLSSPTKTTFASQSPRSQSGSLTAALRNALNDAAKDGLAQDTPDSQLPPLAETAQPQPAATPTMAASPSQAVTANPSQLVELNSSPFTAPKPDHTPVVTTAKAPAVPAQVIENPTVNSSRVVTAAPKIDVNPLRSEASATQSPMPDLASSPIGAKPAQPQAVYPAQQAQPAAEPVAKPSEATTLVAFQTNVHAGDSIVTQLKQSRRVNQFRPMFDAEENGAPSPAAQAAAAAVKAVPAQPTPQVRPAVVAAAPTPAPALAPAPSLPVVEPTPAPTPAQPAVVAAKPVPTPVAAAVEVPTPVQVAPTPARPTVVAATPVPVEIPMPQPSVEPQLPTDLASTAPLANPATVNPAKQLTTPVRPEAFAQLSPSEMSGGGASLEQPGSESLEPPTIPEVAIPHEELATTTPNPVRAVPRVAVPPTSANTPHVASRLTPPTPPPVVVPLQETLIPRPDPVASPHLAPVVTVEEYRRMQAAKRNQATRRY